MSKLPQIRFAGFVDDWERCRFDNLVTIRRGLTYSPVDIANCGIRVLRSSNIKENQFVVYNNDIFVNPSAADIGNVNNGDILITSANGSSKLVGKHAVVQGLQDEAVPGGFMLLAETEESYFVNALMSSSWYTKFIDVFVAGGNGAIGNLNKADLENQIVFIPGERNERKKTGDLFKAFDNLITLHQRTYDKLLNFKKAMLEKMFPREGENEPEIRFSGFTGAWEQRTLLSTVDSIIDFRGRTPKKLGMDWSRAGCLALSALNVKDGYIDPSADAHYGSQELYDKWMSGKELHKGQVIFTTEAPMGNVAQIPDDKRYILSQRTIAFNVKKDVISEKFLAVLLKSPRIFNTLTSLSSGGTAKGVSQKSLSELDVSIPVDLSEQVKIGAFIKTMDNLITFHQRKLEKLQNIKKSLLEKMFV